MKHIANIILVQKLKPQPRRAIFWRRMRLGSYSFSVGFELESTSAAVGVMVVKDAR